MVEQRIIEQIVSVFTVTKYFNVIIIFRKKTCTIKWTRNAFVRIKPRDGFIRKGTPTGKEESEYKKSERLQ